MKEIKWNYSKIDALNYCLRRFYLRYSLHEPPIRLSAYVKGSLLHGLIENFWNRLGTEQEVEADKKNKKKKASEKKQYFNEENFSEYAVGQWKRIIRADYSVIEKVKELEKKTVENRREEKKLERKKMKIISWRDDKEKYVIQGILPKICRPLFKKILEEGRPEFNELQFNFLLGKRNFNGRIDEVRLRDGKVVIRDYKSGSPWMGHMKLEYDPQLTFYNMGFCSLCIQNEEFSKKLGLESVRAGLKELVEKQGVLIYGDFEEEFFMIEALQRIEEAKLEKERPFPKKTDFIKEKDYEESVKRRNSILSNIPKLIYATKRDQTHFYELMRMIDMGERRIKSSEIPAAESGRKCDSCDMKLACERKILKENYKEEDSSRSNLRDSYNQSFFSFADSDFIDLKETQKYAPLYKQKKISWRRKRG